MRAWLSFFTRPLAAILVIVLFGMMAGLGRGLMLEGEAGGGASWTKASMKIQLSAVIHEVAAFKLTPLAKTQKTVWHEFCSGLSVVELRPSCMHAPQVVLSAPELPSCPWVGVIVLRV